MAKKLLEIAADIIESQASTYPMSSDEVAVSLKQIFLALQAMQKAENEGSALEFTPFDPGEAYPETQAQPISARDSIQEDKIICLECGTSMRQLTAKHLKTHGTSPREYKKKHGFSLKTPLAARSLTASRSAAAKTRGLPANLVKFQEDRRQKKSRSK